MTDFQKKDVASGVGFLVAYILTIFAGFAWFILMAQNVSGGCKIEKASNAGVVSSIGFDMGFLTTTTVKTNSGVFVLNGLLNENVGDEITLLKMGNGEEKLCSIPLSKINRNAGIASEKCLEVISKNTA